MGVRDQIIEAAFKAFRTDADTSPAMTLRGGDAVDGYAEPTEFDATADEPTDAYLEAFAFNGLPYLDAASWRHYLPRLMEYVLGHVGGSQGLVADGVLSSLRPPDREPPRLTSLDSEQEAVIVTFLEYLSFSNDAPAEQDFALQVLEEWWVPNALFRRNPGLNT